MPPSFGDARDPISFRVDCAPLEVPAWFDTESRVLNVELDPADTARLARFLAILLEANNALNLTAITDPDEAWRKHILDALTLIPILADLPEGARVADVGSGGGVPGIPLAICLPSLRFTLIEATGKKTAFLKAAAGALDLSNIEIVAERAEVVGQDYKSDRGRESFDAAIARALGRLNVAAELTVPLVKPGGLIVLVKGEKAQEEMSEAGRALGLLGARHAGTIATPTGRLVVLEKASRTPRTYPRPSGEPKRKPLA